MHGHRDGKASTEIIPVEVKAPVLALIVYIATPFDSPPPFGT